MEVPSSYEATAKSRAEPQAVSPSPLSPFPSPPGIEGPFNFRFLEMKHGGGALHFLEAEGGEPGPHDGLARQERPKAARLAALHFALTSHVSVPFDPAGFGHRRYPKGRHTATSGVSARSPFKILSTIWTGAKRNGHCNDEYMDISRQTLFWIWLDQIVRRSHGPRAR